MAAGTGDAGLVASTRRLLATLLQIAQLRLELLATEFESEKLRVFEAIVWIALAFILATAGISLAIALLVLLMPAESRGIAMGVLALLCLGGAGAIAWHARRRLASPSGPIAATVAELGRDRAELGDR